MHKLLSLLMTLGLSASAIVLPVSFAPLEAAETQSGLRVVILPFRNLTRQPADEWLADSFAESLTMGLLKVEALQLVERGQLQNLIKEQQFGQSIYADEASAPKLGKLLGATVVVLGSYQKVGEQLQANVRFVDVETGKIDHQRAAQVQGRFEQIFDLQKQLATELVTQLKVQAKPAELAQMDNILKATQSTEAYKLYNEGLQHFRMSDSLSIEKAIESFKQALERDPKYSLALAGLAEAYAVKAREFSQLKVLPPQQQFSVKGPNEKALARKYAEQALALNPDLPQVLRALAWVEQSEGNRQGAMDFIKKAIQANPKDSDSLVTYINFRFENDAGSIDLARLRQEFQAMGANLDDPWLQYSMGALSSSLESLKAHPRLELPRQLLEAAEAKLPDYPYIPLALMGLAIRQDKPQEAEQHFRKAYALGKNSPETLAGLATMLLGQERYQEAYQLAQEAHKLNPESISVRLTLADCLYFLDRKAEAEALYAELSRHYPESALIAYSRGMLYFAHDQDFAKARPLFEQSLKFWEQSPQGVPRSILVYFLAVMEFAGNDYQAAITHFEELLKDPIYYSQAYEMLAQVYSTQQNYPAALEAYTSYLLIHPEAKESEDVQQQYRWYYLLDQWGKDGANVAVLNDLAQLSVQRKAPELAESYWKAALNYEPENTSVLYNFGSYYLQAGQAAQAKPLLEKAVALKADYVKAWYNLGLVYQSLGDSQAAKQAWRKVLSLDPKHTGAQQALNS